MVTLVFLAFVCNANASRIGQFTGIERVAGDVLTISAPRNINNGVMEGNRFAKLFVEQINLPVLRPIPVDAMGVAGWYDDPRDFSGGHIWPEKVNSYFLHVDSKSFLGLHWWPEHYEGSITFTDPIQGIIGFADTLIATRELEASGTWYPSRRWNYHDLDPIPHSPIRDRIQISQDLKTLHFDFRNLGRMDQMRIITAAVPVPEPAGITLATGLIGFLLWRRTAKGRGGKARQAT